jgi:hypothetical protein
MSDLSLFRLDSTQAIPLPGTAQPGSLPPHQSSRRVIGHQGRNARRFLSIVLDRNADVPVFTSLSHRNRAR